MHMEEVTSVCSNFSSLINSVIGHTDPTLHEVQTERYQYCLG